MFIALQIILAVAAGGVLLTLASQTFADSVSRIFEAALEGVEYRMALRASRREEWAAEPEKLYARALAQGEY